MESVLESQTQPPRDLHIPPTPPPPPQLILSARCIHILPVIKDFCLISVVKLCDDGFAVNFNTKNVFLRKLNDVLTGYRDATTGLYLIYFDKP